MDNQTILADKAMTRAVKRLVPFLTLMYVLSFLDRSNIGFAKNFLQTDVGISPQAFAMGAGLFFFGYSVFEVPSNIIMHYVGARRWMARIMITWGLAAAAFAWVTSDTMFLILRVLLGIAEAGFFPGVVVFMTYWFTKERRAKINGLFYFSVPGAFIIGGPLSGWLIEHMDGVWNHAGWQWMFAVEGILAAIVGVVAIFYLTDKPSKAKWMPDDEKEALQAVLEKEYGSNPPVHGNPLKVLGHPKVLYLSLTYFWFNWCFYGVNFYMPTQIAAFMKSEVNFMVGMVSTIPWLISCVAIWILTCSSDRSGRCGSLVGCSLLMAAFGIALSSVSNPILGILGLGLGAGGILAAMPVFWTIPPRFLSGLSLASAVALINSIGVLGGWCAPIARQWFTDHFGPAWGLYVLAVPGVFAAIMVFGTIGMGIGSRVTTRQQLMAEAAKKASAA